MPHSRLAKTSEISICYAEKYEIRNWAIPQYIVSGTKYANSAILTGNFRPETVFLNNYLSEAYLSCDISFNIYFLREKRWMSWSRLNEMKVCLRDYLYDFFSLWTKPQTNLAEVLVRFKAVHWLESKGFFSGHFGSLHPFSVHPKCFKIPPMR